MEPPFFATAASRTEALRWLTIAEKLLSARDLLGSKSFATRARESDPTLSSVDEILAVVDTLLAGDSRIGNDYSDWYSILRLTPHQGRDPELVANQYRRLVHLLNPQKNKFPYAEQAFRLLVEAWTVLSNPSKKFLYDKELAFYLQPQQHQTDPFNDPIHALQQNLVVSCGSGVAQPQFHGGESGGGVGPSHSTQVLQARAQPRADPVVGGSTRESQNYPSFSSGYNFDFGSGSGSKSSYRQFNTQAQQINAIFDGAVVSAPVATQQQCSNIRKQLQQNYLNAGGKNVNGNKEEMMENKEDLEKFDLEERRDFPRKYDGSTFWTACPYCYYIYEYPGVYADCALRCQNCTKAFQAVVVPSPPPIVDGQEEFFCCWGFLPFGFSMENWEKNKVAASAWTPFSPMFTCPKRSNIGNKRVGGRSRSTPKVYVGDDEVLVEISSSSEYDDDWLEDRNKKRKNKEKIVKGKGANGTPYGSANKQCVDNDKNVNAEDVVVCANAVEMPNKLVGEARGAKNFGELDLNVVFRNEGEEPASRMNQGNEPGCGEDDNIEGIGFFEGLDEWFSSLPIFNVVGDDKIKAA